MNTFHSIAGEEDHRNESAMENHTEVVDPHTSTKGLIQPPSALDHESDEGSISGSSAKVWRLSSLSRMLQYLPQIL